MTVDVMRSTAIILMVVFHFIYDLKFLNVINADIPDGLYWVQFRWLIITLFFLCVGISLRFKYQAGWQFGTWFSGFIKTLLAAIAISIASYIAIPKNWIFFGVLHFIALSYVLALPFLRAPRISLLCGVILLILGALQIVPGRWPFHLLFDGLPGYTNDYVRLTPWFGMVLIGVYLGKTQTLQKDPIKKYLSHTMKKGICWVSGHSLMIYLLHQPVLLSGIYLLSKMVG